MHKKVTVEFVLRKSQENDDDTQTAAARRGTGATEARRRTAGRRRDALDAPNARNGDAVAGHHTRSGTVLIMTVRDLHENFP